MEEMCKLLSNHHFFFCLQSKSSQSMGLPLEFHCSQSSQVRINCIAVPGVKFTVQASGLLPSSRTQPDPDPSPLFISLLSLCLLSLVFTALLSWRPTRWPSHKTTFSHWEAAIACFTLELCPSSLLPTPCAQVKYIIDCFHVVWSVYMSKDAAVVSEVILLKMCLYRLFLPTLHAGGSSRWCPLGYPFQYSSNSCQSNSSGTWFEIFF